MPNWAPEEEEDDEPFAFGGGTATAPPPTSGRTVRVNLGEFMAREHLERALTELRAMLSGPTGLTPSEERIATAAFAGLQTVYTSLVARGPGPNDEIDLG